MGFKGHSVNRRIHVLTWGLVALSADPPQVPLYRILVQGGRCGSCSPPSHSAITPVTALAHLPLFARYHAIPPTPPRKTRTPSLSSSTSAIPTEETGPERRVETIKYVPHAVGRVHVARQGWYHTIIPLTVRGRALILGNANGSLHRSKVLYNARGGHELQSILETPVR